MANGRQRRGWPTMEQVAERAGVSIMTVSRVLSAPDKVRPATRSRIEEAIRDLGYVPDRAARGLASRRSGIVAALISTLNNSVLAETVEGLTTTLRGGGSQVLLGATHYSAAEEEELLAAILERRPDGVVLTGSVHTPAARSFLRNARIPVVETWDLPDDPVDMVVGFSNKAACAALTHQLIDLGYRRIAFASGSLERDSRGAQRYQGYQEALRERGLGEGRWIATDDALASITTGSIAVKRLMEEAADSDALLCVSDVVAFGAIMACHRLGWKVPDRLAVAGFGDFDIAHEIVPSLTTLRIPGRLIGERAAGLVMDPVAGHATEARVIDVGFEVVRRASA